MKLFTGAYLIIYFFIYGLLAWVINTAIYSLKEQKYVSTGVLGIPILGVPAILITIMIIVLSGKNVSYYGMLLMAFIDYLILEKLGLVFLQRLLLKKEIRSEKDRYGRSLKLSCINSCIAVAIAFIFLKTLHPIIFSVVSLIPDFIVNIIATVLIVLLLSALITVYIFARKYPMQCISSNIAKRKNSFGEWISKIIWKKIYKLYPSLLEENFEESSKGILDADKLLEEHGVIFASGINIDKLVWGLGAVILTVALSRVKRQNNISIFISGFFFGGVFEYLCSVFTEVFFGMKFWDYSYMPFNIDGRTNLLFMFFWGIVALVWFRFIYPPLSKTIEKIPPVTRTVLAFIIMTFFVCNGIVTSMVMIRTTGRKKQPVARNVIEQFIDDEYPNDAVRKLWPNMDFLEE